MNISKNNTTPKTRDGHIVKVGDILYWADYARIKQFKVKAWHDGKTANFNAFDKNEKKLYWVDMRGRGGKCVFPEKEKSIFAGIPLSCCYYKLENAKKYLVNHWKSVCDRIKNSEPKKISTKYGI
jgi:hypothetical protein